jgi:hypothetical protein
MLCTKKRAVLLITSVTFVTFLVLTVYTIYRIELNRHIRCEERPIIGKHLATNESIVYVRYNITCMTPTKYNILGDSVCIYMQYYSARLDSYEPCIITHDESMVGMYLTVVLSIVACACLLFLPAYILPYKYHSITKEIFIQRMNDINFEQ